MTDKQKEKRRRFFPAANPCLCCVHRGRCDYICWHRARWWDVTMTRLRAVLTEAADGLEA